MLFGCLAGCNRKDAPVAPVRAEQPVAAVPAQPKPPQPEPSQARPATLEEAMSALKRVFGDDVAASRGFNPVFMTGDFNGDGIEDLAVIVRPAASKLGEVNDELANWILQDADRYFIAPPGKSAISPPLIERPKITDEDVLAVIHGYGPPGWRNPEARQAYVVKNAAAVYSGGAPSNSVKQVKALRLPFKTLVLKGQRGGKTGYLFWTGSAYAWLAAR